MPKATSGPVKITKSATSWGSSCRMVPAATLQPKEFPQPLKAAPMKKPSQRLWKKSPMTTAPTSRALALNLATGSSVSAFPVSTEDSSPDGGAADPPGPLTASMMILQIVSTTGGNTRPARVMVPQRQTTSTSALHPTATRWVASKRSKKKAQANKAPAAKAKSMAPKTGLADIFFTGGNSRNTPMKVAKFTINAPSIGGPQSVSSVASVASAASGMVAFGSMSLPWSSLR